MKVFLANIEADFVIEGSKPKYYLESYFYLKKTIQLQLMQEVNMFLLDSGAFTFMNAKKEKAVNIDEYLDNYIAFINKYDVKYFFELDTDSVHGLDKVLEMRGKLEAKTGKKCIPVWHKSRGIECFKKLCKEYDYIAIGGFVTKEIKENEFAKVKQLLNYAKFHNVKVHGLGFTSMKYLDKLPFYSVDSTSFKSGRRFGQVHHFDGKKIVSKKRPDGKRVKDYHEVDKINLQAWLQFQKYAEIYL